MSVAKAAPGLTDLARSHHEGQPWLALLDAAGEAAHDKAWQAAVPGAAGWADERTPVLAGATFTVPARLLRRWLRTLFTTAAAGGGPAASLAAAARADTDRLAALLEAGLVEDAGRVAAIAAGLGADADAAGVVAGMATLPLLRACGAHWADRIPPAWSEGYCPVCGAWPGLVEVRGLERARRLRCLRCAADWGAPWLRCPYCGTADHERLGSLVLTREAEGELPLRRALIATGVDTCGVCRGYLKTVTTLGPTPAADLGLLDLATVELDAAALARGGARPAGPGAPLGARVVTQASGGWWRA
jgi:FdhE protein